MPTKKLQVFVSSTYTDLKAERQAAVEAILKTGNIPAGMELFAAGNESQMETIRRWIDESDVYMLILGGRYGSVDPKTSLSYTELEYDYAVSQDKPFFAVVATEEAIDEKVKSMGKSVIETDSPKELKEFREKVLKKISSFFTDLKDIKLSVHETLADFRSRYEFSGWVSGKELPDSEKMLEEGARLRKERDEALDQLEKSKALHDKLPVRTGRWADDDFAEILQSLRAQKIKTSLFNKDGDEEIKEVSVMRIFDVLRDSFVTGVANQQGMSDVDNLLYFNVFPKLEIFDLASLERVAGVQWRRYRISTKGKAFLVYFDKQMRPATTLASVVTQAESKAPSPSTDSPKKSSSGRTKQTKSGE